jgi:glycosyltransferase involved in cell wall biosynthesis
MSNPILDRKPIITVITVVRDDVEGLQRTAESLLRRLSKKVSWLIVDGLSTDGTEKVVEALADRPHVTVASRPPSGIYDAMNFGWQLCEGEWCWFINAGDVLLDPLSVIRALELTTKNRDAALVGTPVIYLGPTGRVFSIAEARAPDLPDDPLGSFHHQGALIRREAIELMGGFRTDLELAADGALIDDIVRSFPSVADRVPLVGFFLGGASTIRHLQVLRETNSYRPGTYSMTKVLELSLKNRGVRLVLWANRVTFLKKLSDRYLRARERRALDALDG